MPFESDLLWRRESLRANEKECMCCHVLNSATLKFYDLCRVGDTSVAQSSEFNFTTGKPIGPASFPARIGLIADLGITSNSTVSLQHLAANQPEMALFVGGGLPGLPSTHPTLSRQYKRT